MPLTKGSAEYLGMAFGLIFVVLLFVGVVEGIKLLK